MYKVYLVKHCYDVDGGFGDAIPAEEVVAVFSDRETAESYVESFEYNEATVYDRPYAELTFGEFVIKDVLVFERGEFPTDEQANHKKYDMCKSWYEESISEEETYDDCFLDGVLSEIFDPAHTET